MAISLSLGGPNTFVSDSSDSVLIGTVNGVVTLERSGNKWNATKQYLDRCHIHAIVIVPDSPRIYAGVSKGSIYGSADGGATWAVKENGLTEKNIYSLNYVSSGGILRLYAGTEPGHLFQSADFGETWSEIVSLRSVPSVPKWTFPSPPHEAHVKFIGFDPHDSDTIYACVEQGGLFRSKDRGQRWEELHGFDLNLPFEVPDGAAADDVHRIVIKSSDPKWLYITGGVGVCRSRDAGNSWEHVMPPQSRIGYPDALLMHPHREDLMFTAGASSNPKSWRTTKDADAAIARSRDGGSHWEILSRGLPAHMQSHVAAMALSASGGKTRVFAGTTSGEIFLSEDEGDTWAQIADVAPISKANHYKSLGAGEKVKIA